MQKKQKRFKAVVAITAVSLALLFCSCVKELPDGGIIDVEGRETLFAPAETTAQDETTDTTAPVETTSPLIPETTSPNDETTAPETETTVPETTDSVETENPVFTGGFSGLY